MSITSLLKMKSAFLKRRAVSCPIKYLNESVIAPDWTKTVHKHISVVTSVLVKILLKPCWAHETALSFNKIAKIKPFGNLIGRQRCLTFKGIPLHLSSRNQVKKQIISLRCNSEKSLHIYRYVWGVIAVFILPIFICVCKRRDQDVATRTISSSLREG